MARLTDSQRRAMFAKKKGITFNPKQVSSGRGKSNFIITTQRFQEQKNPNKLSSKDLKAIKRDEEFEAKTFGRLDITRRGREIG